MRPEDRKKEKNSVLPVVGGDYRAGVIVMSIEGLHCVCLLHMILFWGVWYKSISHQGCWDKQSDPIQFCFHIKDSVWHWNQPAWPPHNLSLNAEQTKNDVVDFRRVYTQHAPLTSTSEPPDSACEHEQVPGCVLHKSASPGSTTPNLWPWRFNSVSTSSTNWEELEPPSRAPFKDAPLRAFWAAASLCGAAHEHHILLQDAPAHSAISWKRLLAPPAFLWQHLHHSSHPQSSLHGRDLKVLHYQIKSILMWSWDTWSEMCMSTWAL